MNQCMKRFLSVHSLKRFESPVNMTALQCNIMCSSVLSTTYILLQDLYKTPWKWNPWPSEILPEALLQPLLPLPYIIAENNSTPKQTGKCLMILYPSMSSWCQWNIVPWAHISFPSRRWATAGGRERGPGTKFKHHFTLSNKRANGGDGREESVTWKGCRRWMGSSLLAILWLLAPFNASTSITTQLFLWNTWNTPSKSKCTTNIYDTFLVLWDRTPNICGRLFPLILETWVTLNSFRFSKASTKWITKWHVEIEYSQCFPAKLFRV